MMARFCIQPTKVQVSLRRWEFTVNLKWIDDSRITFSTCISISCLYILLVFSWKDKSEKVLLWVEPVTIEGGNSRSIWLRIEPLFLRGKKGALMGLSRFFESSISMGDTGILFQWVWLSMEKFEKREGGVVTSIRGCLQKKESVYVSSLEVSVSLFWYRK